MPERCRVFHQGNPARPSLLGAPFGATLRQAFTRLLAAPLSHLLPSELPFQPEPPHGQLGNLRDEGLLRGALARRGAESSPRTSPGSSPITSTTSFLQHVGKIWFLQLASEEEAGDK